MAADAQLFCCLGKVCQVQMTGQDHVDSGGRKRGKRHSCSPGNGLIAALREIEGMMSNENLDRFGAAFV